MAKQQPKAQAPTKPAAPVVEKSFDQEFDEQVAAAESGKTAPATDAGEVIVTDPPDEPGTNQTSQQTTAEQTESTDADDGAGDATTTTTTTQPTEDEIWSGLTDAQKAALDTLRTRASAAEHRANSDATRVSALQRKINELSEAATPAGKPAAAAPTAAQVQEALADPEAFKQLQEDYPSIAKPIMDFATRLEQRMMKTLDDRTKPLLKRFDQTEAEREQSEFDKQAQLLADAHPDWKAIKTSKPFEDWVNSQPPVIAAGLGSRNASDAIYILDLFKTSTGAGQGSVSGIQQRRDTRVKQAAAVTAGVSGRAAQPGRPAIPDNFDAAWDEMDRRARA